MTRIRAATAEAIADAAELLRQGGLVALPTETVYGLGADARQGPAVARIYEAKGRPSFNPLIVHCAGLERAQRYAVFSSPATRLAEQIWPGALTLVLPLRRTSGLSSLVTAGLPSVALRVPAHPVARALLSEFDGPIAAPSANPSGRISPTTARHVETGLGPAVDLILDGGACPVGVESTILDMSTDTPRLLRAGGLPVEEITECLGRMPVLGAEDPKGKITAPGQLSSHYAPRAELRLNATEFRQDETGLGFGPAPGAQLNLAPDGDLRKAAANLFAMLHELDATGAQRIAVSPIPETGLGLAINDRLRRAAAPR